MNAAYIQLGVAPAGTSLVWKTIEPGRTRYRPFCPEVWLADWDRLGLHPAAEILGEAVLRSLKIFHPEVFSRFASLLPPHGDEGKTRAQIEEIERAAEQAEPVSSLAPFTYDGEMREARVGVGIGFDNCSLRLVPLIGDKVEGVSAPVTLDALALMEPALAWRYLGAILLGKVAAMHPDAFRPFASFAPLLVAPL